MVLAADDVCDAHFQIIHDVGEMKHRLAVRTQNHKIRVLLLAVGEFTDNIADNEVVDGDRLALHFEFDRAFMFIGEAVRQQRLNAALIIFLPLTLEIRAAIAFARAGGVAGERAFVPVKSEPAQAVEDDVHSFLRIARGVGVLDAEDERAAGMAGVEPVEERGARAADVQIAGRRRGETDARFHGCDLFNRRLSRLAQMKNKKGAPMNRSASGKGANYLPPRMASFAALATRNFTTRLAGIEMASPVLGLRPMRAARFFSTSLPMPGSVKVSFACL